VRLVVLVYAADGVVFIENNSTPVVGESFVMKISATPLLVRFVVPKPAIPLKYPAIKLFHALSTVTPFAWSVPVPLALMARRKVPFVFNLVIYVLELVLVNIVDPKFAIWLKYPPT
jgi:hypothetical protein